MVLKRGLIVFWLVGVALLVGESVLADEAQIKAEAMAKAMAKAEGVVEECEAKYPDSFHVNDNGDRVYSATIPWCVKEVIIDYFDDHIEDKMTHFHTVRDADSLFHAIGQSYWMVFNHHKNCYPKGCDESLKFKHNEIRLGEMQYLLYNIYLRDGGYILKYSHEDLIEMGVYADPNDFKGEELSWDDSTAVEKARHHINLCWQDEMDKLSSDDLRDIEWGRRNTNFCLLDLLKDISDGIFTDETIHYEFKSRVSATRAETLNLYTDISIDYSKFSDFWKCGDECFRLQHMNDYIESSRRIEDIMILIAALIDKEGYDFNYTDE